MPSRKERIELIKDCGYKSVSELARAIGWDATNLHKVVNGTQKPTLDTIFKLSNALKRPISQILTYWYYDEVMENVRIVNNAS